MSEFEATPEPQDSLFADLGEQGWRGVVSRAAAQALFVTGVVLILSIGGLFESADRIMLDLFIRADDLHAFRNGEAGSREVVIASLSETELTGLRNGQAGARARLAQHLETLAQAGAKAIVLNVALTIPSPDDAVLARAIKQAGNVLLKSTLETPRPSQYGLTLPVRTLRNEAEGHGFTSWVPDSDGVVRRFLAALPGGFELSLPVAAYAAAADLEPGVVQSDIRFEHKIVSPGDVDSSFQVRLRFPGPPRVAFPTFDYEAVEQAQDIVQGRVVVIGPMEAGAAGMMTPLAESWRESLEESWPEPTTVTELLAAAIDTLISGRLVHRVPLGWLIGSWLLMALLASVVAELVPARPALVVCLLTGVAWTLAGRISYGVLHELPVTEGWVVLLACLSLGIYHRLGRDVAVHQRQAWQAESERRRLADLDAAKRAVIGTVVHDLKVPVAIIKGQAMTLADDPQRELGEALHQEFLETIAGQCDRLDALIEDILDVDPDRQIVLHRHATDLRELVAHAVATHEATVSRHTFEIIAEPLPPLMIDPGKLTRVVNNLLSNAVKYSPAGGKVRITLSRAEDEAVIEVADPGIGMTSEQMERLFGLFVRVLDDPHAIPGTGVGLYSVKHLVELHGGRVEVGSTLGEGSTFTIHLPIAPPEPPAPTGSEAA